MFFNHTLSIFFFGWLILDNFFFCLVMYTENIEDYKKFNLPQIGLNLLKIDWRILDKNFGGGAKGGVHNLEGFYKGDSHVNALVWIRYYNRMCSYYNLCFRWLRDLQNCISVPPSSKHLQIPRTLKIISNYVFN